jgi:glycosyltransferase involved in cell wall biosynthesis
MYLAVASLLSTRYGQLVFQSSFPHELTIGNPLKRWLAKLIFRRCKNHVNAIVAVSPKGIERMRNYFPEPIHAEYIPLLADNPTQPQEVDNSDHLQQETRAGLRFVYLGTHAPSRQLPFVIKAIMEYFEGGGIGSFDFFGGSEQEMRSLMALPGVSALISGGKIRFHGVVQRSEIWTLLQSFDVGLSLAPPKKTNEEMSPTKLSEYMASGLAVIGTRGIALQEIFLAQSKGGILVEWDVQSISEAFHLLERNFKLLSEMKENAKRFGRKQLNYDNYIDCFYETIFQGNERVSTPVKHNHSTDT